MEYYFFSSLDRKHANRWRTSRTTSNGYWKTTGKDRPVYGVGKEVVGMKKTLVYHIGKARKGERSNWVMHEYRLGSESSSTAFDPQGTSVVCKVFQKSGSGPQNGAQYGAPFVEEEWREEAQDLVPNNGTELVVVMEVDDLEEKQDLPDGHESIVLVTETDGGSHAENLNKFIEADQYINHATVANNAVHNYGMEEQYNNTSNQNDGYLELKDIFESANGLSTYNHIRENGVSERITTLPQADDTELYSTIPIENVDANGSCHYTDTHIRAFTGQSADDLSLFAHDYPSAQPVAEDEHVFYDALGNNSPFTGDILENMMKDLSGYDVVDDFIAYFDATENNLPNDLEIFSSANSVQLNAVSEVHGSHGPTECNATQQVPKKNVESGASSSAINQFETLNESNTALPEMQVNKGWNTALRKRVVNMLGSISAPPAMAEERTTFKGKTAKILFTSSSLTSSINVTTARIEIQNVILTESKERLCTKKKNEYMGLRLFYEPVRKMHGRVFLKLLKAGFYLFGFSVLILSASLKMGMCFCDE